ncbi:hypothetical protein [uncultured Apibacter sp.]|uniref:hypothetical protein n=1 Tax=uncultured Apibacter sp. TaxID=1778616 RepID=UPI0025F8982B|nr:hypothetical protein [uncultured Apibacter sp.]
MNAKEIFQKEVLEEIKSIAAEISRVQSFSGLLSHQQKIQNLYEKFIFLKQLSTSKYQQILENLENKENVNEKKVEIRDFYHESKNEETIEEVQEKPTLITEKIENNEVKEVAEKNIIEEDNREREENLTKSDLETIQIPDFKLFEKSKVLRPISLDFNDSIAFISQLFNGSKADMDAEFGILNQTRTIEEAKKWMEEMFVKYNWKNKGEYVERLSGLIVCRFGS